MKQFKNLILAGALVAGLAGFAVSCDKYGADIDDLKSQISAVQSQVDQVQNLVNSGAVITNVTSNNGGVTITLSNGQSYTIANGQNGADGKDADVWTIGTDGFWYKNGTKTEYKAVADSQSGSNGKDGVDGKDGKDGADGQNGADGKNGNYWKIEKIDGKLYFVEYDGTTGKPAENSEPVEIEIPTGGGSSSEGGVTAVWDTESYELKIYGVDGADEIVIYLASTLKSLAFIPETIFDGLGVISVESFNYPAAKLNTKFPFVTVATEEKPGEFLTTAPTVVSYRFNPQNVNPEDYSFDFVNRSVYTRGEKDDNKLVTIVSGPEKHNGHFDFEIKLGDALQNDTPDHEQTNDIVALRAIANDKSVEGANENIVSDYSYVETVTYFDYRIIHKDFYKKGEPKYYRNDKFVEITDTTDYNTGKGIYVEGVKNPASVALNYKEEVDLLDYVYTYSAGYGDVVDSLIGVEYEFFFAGLDAKGDVVLDVDGTKAPYETKTGEKTNQNAFVVLDGSVIKVDESFVSLGTPAIGRTPLVYVRAKVNGKYLAEAFIKIQIIEEEVEPEPEETLGWDVFIIHDVNFDYDKLTTAGTYVGEEGTVAAPHKNVKRANNELNVNWTEVNQWVLDDELIDMSYETFGQKYDLENPQIILVKDSKGNTVQPGATVPVYGDKNTVIEDFNNIGTFYPGVFGDKLSPDNWKQSTNIVDVKLTDKVEADGEKHYVYVLFQPLDKAGEKVDYTQHVGVVLEFVYFVPKHEHEFTIFDWVLNPDYVLNNNPEKPWLLNKTKPTDVTAAADTSKYGVVRVKGQEDANKSGIIEHFKEYLKVAKDSSYNVINPESTYSFLVLNYTTDDVNFNAPNVGTVKDSTINGKKYSSVQISGKDLISVVDAKGGTTPDIVLSEASRLQESKEILVEVTEICNGDATQRAKGYYYVVFDALSATINFNEVYFGTYRDFSDYALVHELIESVVDENGNDIIKWDEESSAWVAVGEYADVTSAIEVTIAKLTYTYGHNEASFGGRLRIWDETQKPQTDSYTVEAFGEEAIEWWNMGTDLQNDKYFGAVVEITLTPTEGEAVKIATGEHKFTVLSTERSADKNPNHEPDGTLADPIWKN